MSLTFSRNDSDGVSVIHISGTLDVNTAPQLEAARDKLTADHMPRVEADVSGLDLIDSSGVAALVAMYKHVRNSGGSFKVVGARDQPLAIFKLLRMDKVFLA